MPKRIFAIHKSEVKNDGEVLNKLAREFLKEVPDVLKTYIWENPIDITKPDDDHNTYKFIKEYEQIAGGYVYSDDEFTILIQDLNVLRKALQDGSVVDAQKTFNDIWETHKKFH